MGLLFLFVMGCIMTVLVIGPACMAAEQRKQKREKIELMREFPQHAGEIFQSMEEDEARFRTDRAKYFDDMGKSFHRPRRQINGLLKFGLGLARQLTKK